MEELLNKLIEKGWKPRGKNYGVIDFLGTLVFVDLNDGRLLSKNALDLRKLTSKESGLWQFVCENGMIKKPDIDRGEVHNWDNPNNWLCKSSLKDESELEDFLLSNIKVEGEV